MSLRRLALYTSVFFPSLLRTAVGDTCSAVSNTTGIHIERQYSVQYDNEQTNYWSTGCGALKPSCILYPSSAEEVAAIVKILNGNNETFVVKSGGHNPNKHFASIDGGSLISTRELNEVTFDPTSMTVRVGPGNDWDEVQDVLKDAGVTVVGGRIGEVGVGGYVVGGGLSFLSGEYGWAANNIVEYEVVLANASIITVSNSSHPDLYKALKGGGNNYGIVTSYTMIAHPQGEIWGGNLVFSVDQTPQLLAAIRDFTENDPDEKAGIIMTSEITAYGALYLWIMFLFYDSPSPPPGVFDRFINIGPSTNNCKTRSYYDLLSYNNFAVVKGSIYTITTETFPLPNATVGAEVMQSFYDHWRNTTNSILEVSGLIGSIAFQPVPKSIARKARQMGGDMIDLDDEVDRIIIEFNYSYLLSVDDEKVDRATQQVYTGIRDLVTQYQASGHLPDAYLPLFMNDAYFRQDYFGRLRTAGFARSVRDQYDPEGFFAGRTGGWKM